MTLMLSEDQYGTDAARIGFPGLISCMGLVALLDDGSLVGAHVAVAHLEPLLLQKVRSKSTKGGRSIATLYGIANVAEHKKVGCLDIVGKANALGFSGKAYLADLGFAKIPPHGMYAELTSNGPGNVPSVRCAWHDNVNFTQNNGTLHKRVTDGDDGPVKGTITEYKTDAAPKFGEVFSTPFLRPVDIP